MIRWPMLLLLAPLSVLAETSVYTEQGIVTENQTVKEVTDFLLDKVLQSTPSNTVAEKNLDPDDRKSLEAVRERRPRVNLGALGIAPGDQLTFSRDDAIVTIVVPDGKVNFDGEIMSLSAAALKALNRMGTRPPPPADQSTGCLMGKPLMSVVGDWKPRSLTNPRRI